MKYLFILATFCLFSLSAAAQYGKLEPLRNYDDTVYVALRTPKAVIEKLMSSTDKTTKKKGSLIKEIERQLETARGQFNTQRMPVLNSVYFTNNIKLLQDMGVDVNYYVQEYFVYFPRRNQRPVNP